MLALFGATIVIFAGSRLMADPLINLLPPDQGGFTYGFSQVVYEREKRRLHLDDPVPVQYAYWVADVFQGNLGLDLTNKRPIAPVILERLPHTLQLAFAAFIVATLVGLPLGVLSAVKRGSIWDLLGRTFAALGIATPTFWAAMVAILVFSVMLGWLPTATKGEGIAIRNFILPTFVLATHAMAGYLRLMRSAMLDTLDSEYVKLARAKGARNRTVIWKHAFKNAALVPLTYAGLLLAGFITGSIAVEVVFAWPGVARFGAEAAVANNLPVVVAVTLMFTFFYVAINFVVDILYGFVDPRIRYS
jgi:ABC-type dipeptide/oligopeptide/nickel transport system permease component